MQLFATASKGTEGALRDELREHRFRRVRATRGGVAFEGDLVEAARACLELRIAVRVLVELGEFPAPTADALYDGVANVDWSPFVRPEGTLAVRVAGTTSGLVHSQFSARRTKDAIVDQIRHRTGRRPSVDLERPDLLVFVHLGKERATVYADAGGDSLPRRGYRPRVGEASLKENLAAALVRLSGWDRDSELVDPMCGAGTIALEAALWSRDRAPGLTRQHIGLENWPAWDESARRDWTALRDGARARERRDGPVVRAMDIDPALVTATKANANAAGIPLLVRQGDAMIPDDVGKFGTLVTNPPYGFRLDADFALYRALARSFRSGGSSMTLLAGSRDVRRAFGEPSRWVAVQNGPIPCEVLVYDENERRGRE